MKHPVVILLSLLLFGNLALADGYRLEVGHFVISGEAFPRNGAAVDPVQDGCRVEVLEDVGADGIAPPDGGQPGGGDRILVVSDPASKNTREAVFAVNGSGALQMPGGFLTDAAFSAPRIPVNPVWVRVWNAADPAAATACWDSPLYAVLPGFQQIVFPADRWTLRELNPAGDPRRGGRALDDAEDAPQTSAPHAVEIYPNPFNAQARIRLLVTDSEPAALTVFDVLGRSVAALHDGVLAPGVHEFAFDAAGLPTGTYYLAVRRVPATTVHKLLLVR